MRRFVARVLAELEEDKKASFDKLNRARVMFYGAKILAELVDRSQLEERVSLLEQKHFPQLEAGDAH